MFSSTLIHFLSCRHSKYEAEASSENQFSIFKNVCLNVISFKDAGMQLLLFVDTSRLVVSLFMVNMLS